MGKAPISPLQPRDFLILLALADGERHGYGLIKEIHELTDGAVRMDPANLYRAIKRLLRDGLVEDRGRRPAAQARDERRRYYAMTSEGRRVAAGEAGRLEKLTAVARSRHLIPEPGGSL
ncbi:MAG: PadR family transcriptional regulator [Acidobacteriota bacterium]